jgi:hypothetical protein
MQEPEPLAGVQQFETFRILKERKNAFAGQGYGVFEAKVHGTQQTGFKFLARACAGAIQLKNR